MQESFIQGAWFIEARAYNACQLFGVERMQLTVSSDIALRTLIYLGQRDAPVTISEVAEECGVSKSSLMKVVMTLVGANLVLSERGRNGGICLAQEAGNISIGSVIRLMENSLALVECMKDSPSGCPLLPSCRLKPILNSAQEAFFSTLDNHSLADLLKK
jgi:Rrf2 family nitric oxide-sensitive transcriptional repressor